MKYCIMDECKPCNACGSCDRCDLDPNKICDNCCKCIDEAEGFAKINIEDIVMEDELEEEIFLGEDKIPYEAIDPALLAKWDAILEESIHDEQEKQPVQPQIRGIRKRRNLNKHQ